MKKGRLALARQTLLIPKHVFEPDSAVELKMPEARWNPGAAKCPTVKFQRGLRSRMSLR
jgi:hypothetical protein